MPYIKQEDRERLASPVAIPQTPGELNYIISCLLVDYIEQKCNPDGKPETIQLKPSYGLFNEILGALEAAKLEFYRRVVVPYEDEKIHDNGDVYS